MKKSEKEKRPPSVQDKKPADPLALDEIDRRILRILQGDGLTANQTLADRNRFVAPGCLKRVSQDSF
jgi:hypothetical protein